MIIDYLPNDQKINLITEINQTDNLLKKLIKKNNDIIEFENMWWKNYLPYGVKE